MNFFKSISRNVKNIFVGSHKGEDIGKEWIDSKDTHKNQMTYPAPDVLPYDPWFDKYINPLDLMPIATDKPLEENKEDNIHHKMYEIATSKYNPFSIGGSENIHDFDRDKEQVWAEDLPDLAPSEYEP